MPVVGKGPRDATRAVRMLFRSNFMRRAGAANAAFSAPERPLITEA